jgi:hypothetical protein
LQKSEDFESEDLNSESDVDDEEGGKDWNAFEVEEPAGRVAEYDEM